MAFFNVISDEEYTKLNSLNQNGLEIIKTEKERLEQKKDNIESRKQNTERMILLNQTYQLKQKQYLILIMIFVFTFAICSVLLFIQNRLKYENYTIELLLIVVLVIGAISAYYTYDDILARDNIDFNKLSMNNTKLTNPEKEQNRIQSIRKEEGKISAYNQGTCYGQSCCDGTGTEWNSDTGKCEPKGQSSE